MLYACLQRNRDDNGNGRIDADEVKWYPAAIDQYTDIWVGRAALPIETYLYSNEIPTSQGYRRYLSSDGKELYAEEGSSIGSFGFVYANSIWSTNDKLRRSMTIVVCVIWEEKLISLILQKISLRIT